MPPKKATTSQQSAASPTSAPKKISGTQQTGKENAKWMLKDEKVPFLKEQRTVGGPKTGMACKNKWAQSPVMAARTLGLMDQEDET
ncbi:hypothetical protein VTO73DRAFT_13919 [Trametes versicolor]